MRLAHRIAVNRTVVWVHFPIDTIAGAKLGIMLGLVFAIQAATGSVTGLPNLSYAPTNADADLYGNILDGFGRYNDFDNLVPAPTATVKVLNTVWRKAVDEWPDRHRGC